MTEKLNAAKTYKAEHTQFGGLIYPSDFHTDSSRKDNAYSSVIANRIANDKKFDEQCRKNAVNKLKKGGL